MRLTGSRHIRADRTAIWNALTDAEVLRACIPGCQDLAGSIEDGFEATVVQKVGPVKAAFKGAVQLSNVVTGESYTITGEGKGGAAGFAKGGADVQLHPADGGTELVYHVEAKIGGKLAQLGSRIIDGVAKKLADQFFERFQSIVEDAAQEAAPPAAAPHHEPEGFFSKLLAWLKGLFGVKTIREGSETS